MLYGKLDELAPFRTQEKWDNSGLLAGDPDTEVTKVLLVLDITPEAVEEAARLGAQLIISHHPVIFHPLKALEPGTAPTLLARRGIAAICSHTCLDKALVNDCLAAALGLEEVLPFAAGEDGIPMGRIGTLPRPASPAEFAAAAAERLGAPVRYNRGGRTIRRVAVLGGAGAGGDLIGEAAATGADALVTGEAKHHEYLDAARLGITLFDGTHYATERVVLAPLAERLSAAFPEVEFLLGSGGDVLAWTGGAVE